MDTTAPIPYDASAGFLRAAILSLPTVTDDVAVLRTKANEEGGRIFYVLFLNEYVEGHPTLYVDGSGLEGIGSGIGTNVVQRGGSHGRMILPRTEGLAIVAMAHGSDLIGVTASAATLTIRGSLIATNRALSLLKYSPMLNWNGNVKITVTVNDLGYSGSGGIQTVQKHVFVQILPVNDPPSIVYPESYGNTTVSILSEERVHRVMEHCS
jgi:hypothetical protein